MKHETKINSLADLQREKVVLRKKIHAQEAVLRDHYTDISSQMKPILKIVNWVSGNKLFKGVGHEKDGGGGNNWSTIMSMLMAAMGGGLLLRKSRKNMFRSLLAYALDQGVDYIKGKDISEHIEQIKEWLSKKDKEEEADKTNEDSL